MSPSNSLRSELIFRARVYAEAESLAYRLSYGENPTVCFEPRLEQHGNFEPRSYRAILANPAWRKRLDKVHTQGHRCLPKREQGRWRELDTCSSSDALLMNVFCYPGMLRQQSVRVLLGLEGQVAKPAFGYMPCVPLANGRVDRTEVDLRLGSLLAEAKLTEGDFQSVRKPAMLAYRDFLEIFDPEELPQTESDFRSYQLLRNVLAAYASESSFCLLTDARRPDLISDWFAVMKCVKPIGLRTACKILTWQELASALPGKLQVFLAAKYGIQG
ncbi:MAG: hypothetical protein DMG68_04510 [Acidobacteria bacterium]|nr:MAG: hypothetical protein DMG68_04510 [Acidobacteriota bacterium]